MPKIPLVFLTVLLFNSACVKAEQLTGIDETAQLPFWEWRSEYVSIRFVQRLPDQTRAYFAGRGFGTQDVKHIAGYCIFQSVFKNIAPTSSKHVIDYDLRKWRIIYQGKHASLTTREDWAEIWSQRKTRQAQKIAFEWSLLPTQQRYQPKDYNWGMTVYDLPHGTRFDLEISWQVDGEIQKATLKNMQCARDVYIPPPQE